MATDIKASGSIVINSPNIPVDKNSRVETLADVANMTNPCLGGIFYCVATGLHYKITALKSTTFNGVSVPDTAVDKYEVLNSGSTGGGLSVWTGTETEYQALDHLDDNTIYLIEG